MPLTKIVLADIGLNDPDDPSTPDREVTFSSDGTGNVAVRVDQGAGDSGRFKLCLQFESKAPFCQVTTGVSTITGRTLKQKTKWHVTLQGATLGMVTSVDLTITFPAKVPSLSGKDFYLSGGQTYPGFVASFKSRRACPITLVLSNLNPAGTYNTVAEDASEPGSVAPPAAAGCPTPAAGAATYDTIKGHQYKISITSDYGEETFAGINLGWP